MREGRGPRRGRRRRRRKLVAVPKGTYGRKISFGGAGVEIDISI